MEFSFAANHRGLQQAWRSLDGNRVYLPWETGCWNWIFNENPGDNGTAPFTRLAEPPVLLGSDIPGVSTASSSKRKCSSFIQVVQQLDELSWRF